MGAAGLGTALHRDMGVHVVNIDVSTTAVQLAREAAQRAGVRDGVSFVEADAMSLPGSWRGSFDVVIDKGTLDALSCSRSEGEDNVRRMLSEASRVLKPGGVCVLVTTVKEASVRRWVTAAKFQVVDLAHLVTRQSQRRVPVLPNDAYVLRKRRRAGSSRAAAGLRFRGGAAAREALAGDSDSDSDDGADTDTGSGSSGSDGDVSSDGDSDGSSLDEVGSGSGSASDDETGGEVAGTGSGAGDAAADQITVQVAGSSQVAHRSGVPVGTPPVVV